MESQNSSRYSSFKETDNILADRKRFRANLHLETGVFNQLKELNGNQDHEELEKLLSSIFSTMNGLGQFGFVLVMIAKTTGWTPGSFQALDPDQVDPDILFDDQKEVVKTTFPGFVHNLLDLMALSIAELLILPGLKIAYADGDFSIDEQEWIEIYFSKKWGYDRTFIRELIIHFQSRLGDFKYPELNQNLRTICKIFTEINFEGAAGELIQIAEEIMSADGVVHPLEKEEVDMLTAVLKGLEEELPPKFAINNFWDYIFKKEADEEDLQVIDVLRKIPLFEDLTKRELKKVAKIMHERTYNEDEYLFQKGNPGAAMFIIRKGSIKIVTPDGHGGEIDLATLKSGAFLGELALLDNSPRSASAKASDPTSALAFFRSDLNKLINTAPAIGSKIMRKLALIIGQRLKATNDQLYNK